jgi:hypothetical protein
VYDNITVLALIARKSVTKKRACPHRGHALKKNDKTGVSLNLDGRTRGEKTISSGDW